MIKIHPRLVDAVVEHAKLGPAALRRPVKTAAVAVVDVPLDDEL